MREVNIAGLLRDGCDLLIRDVTVVDPGPPGSVRDALRILPRHDVAVRGRHIAAGLPTGAVPPCRGPAGRRPAGWIGAPARAGERPRPHDHGAPQGRRRGRARGGMVQRAHLADGERAHPGRRGLGCPSGRDRAAGGRRHHRGRPLFRHGPHCRGGRRERAAGAPGLDDVRAGRSGGTRWGSSGRARSSHSAGRAGPQGASPSGWDRTRPTPARPRSCDRCPVRHGGWGLAATSTWRRRRTRWRGASRSTA